MNATDTPFFRAFAGRVRTTIADTPKGETTVNTTQPLYGEAADQVRDQVATTVPATFQTDPDAPCSAHAWCVETGHHLDHTGRQVSLPTSGKLPPILTAHLYTDQPAGLPEMNFDPGHDDWREFHSGAELRAETARVRTHLARLDAFADEYDALREAAGETVEEATLQPELIARVEVEAAALSEGTALVFKQYGDLLRVAFDPDHVTEEKARELVSLFVSPQAAALIDAPGEGEKFDPWDETTLPPGAARISAEADGSGFMLAALPPVAVGDEMRMGVHNGRMFADLDLDEARQFRSRTAAFLARVDGMVDEMVRRSTPTEKPRTWSFVDKESGARETYTCMLGCTADHEPDQTRPQVTEEVCCRINDYAPDLPMAVAREEQPVEVLYLMTHYQPWGLRMGQRMPHVTVQVVDGHEIGELDPDGLQVVIDTFQARVDAMRAARLHLIAARAQWLQQRNGGTR